MSNMDDIIREMQMEAGIFEARYMKWSSDDRDQLVAWLKKVVGRKASYLSVSWWGDKWSSAILSHIDDAEWKKVQAILKGKKLGGIKLDARYDAGLKKVYIDSGN